MEQSASRETLRPRTRCPACHSLLHREGDGWACVPCRATVSLKLTGGLPSGMSVEGAARRIASRSKQAGFLTPAPCENCGATDAEMHHSDYFQPTNVNWLCRKCHSDLHRVIPPEQVAAQIEQRRAGRRKLVFHGGTLCSHCLDNAPRPGQRTCSKCHAENERARRARSREGVTHG